MYSIHHALLSFVVGTLTVLLFGPATVFGITIPSGVLVVYATAIGVFIDLDHFLIARVRTGNWRALRFCLRHPQAAFLEQHRIFETGDVGALTRLLSHLLIAGLLVVGLVPISTTLAVVTAVVLYVHLVGDVAWDIRRFRQSRLSHSPPSSTSSTRVPNGDE